MAVWRTKDDVGGIRDYAGLAAAAKKAPKEDYTGKWFDYIWDVMLCNPEEIVAEAALYKTEHDVDGFFFDEIDEAPLAAFKKLHEKNLIYRGRYIVNWCPRCHSALSDLEVEHEEDLQALLEDFELMARAFKS